MSTTGTYTFSSPVNDLVFFADVTDPGEFLKVTPGSGTGSITKVESCIASSISGTTITRTSGTGNINFGLFIVHSTVPFTTLSLTSSVTGSGITFNFCANSVTPAPVFALNCPGSTVTGTLTAGSAAAGVSISVPYTGGNSAAYGAISIASTGITGLTASAAAGTLASGAGNLVLTVSGTPSGNGTANFALTINGQSCTLSVTVNAAAPAGTPVATVQQNPTSPGTSTGIISLTGATGNYPPSTPVSVTYTTPGGGTATFTGTTDGTGVIHIPNLPAGTYGPFVVTVNGGTPSSPGGTATLVDPTPVFALNCPGSTVTGTLTAGSAAAGVSISVPYTGGNSTAYGAISIASTGITGLTASAAAGTLASGAGNLVLTVSGTPSGNGTANFALTINGQSCTLSVTVNAAAPAGTPVATVQQNPTSPGTSTGIISLTTVGGYPPNTPVSVTYTTPGGGTATFTGTTDGTGVIHIPNLPAGTYGPFVVTVNGGTPSSPGGSATLVDPAAACAANAGTITRLP